MTSIWSESIQLPQFKPLKRDTKTDVLIVGGGIAGLLCAHTLTQAGVSCILVEAERICSGVTKNTTAKITAQHGLLYHRLMQKFGLEGARLYLRANLDALEHYRTLCSSFDCDFQLQDAFIYSLGDDQEVEQEWEALKEIEYPAKLVRNLPLPFSTCGAVCFPEQAQFHPLKFLGAIAQNLPIFEQTRVLELEPGAAVTERGRIWAEKIIVATHFPFLNKHGSFFLKLYQHRSYVLALKGAPDLQGMYADASEKGLSFRQWNGLLLLGGGSHRTGKQGGGWKELEEFTARHFSRATEVARWATQDCMSLDGIPYIGPYSKHTPDLYVATGFNKWGMTSAMVAATILTGQILNRPLPYADLFSPSRSILHPQLALNAAESALHLLKPTAPRCPHMGCALEYNSQEHSWDCPCHGSRFDEDGRVLNNPATKNKKR